MSRTTAAFWIAPIGLGLSFLVSMGCNDVEAKNAATADALPPTITSFIVPSMSGSLTVSGIVLAATDNKRVTGYLVTENVTVPSPRASEWNSRSPTSYTFSSAGSKVIYAWVKDAAGNVSSGQRADVTVTAGLSGPSPSPSPTVAPTPSHTPGPG